MTAAAARYRSLGAGVQSSTLLLLALHGRIPASDAAIFADIGCEPAAVYAHLDRLRGQFFLHRQRHPLEQVVLRPRETHEDPPGCGPWTCPHPSGQPDKPADEPVRAGEREGRE